MMNAALYEQYVTAVRAIAEELGDVHSEEELFVAWHERRDIALEVVVALVAEHALGHGPERPARRGVLPIATARSRASAARRSPASAWSAPSASARSGWCCSRT